MSYDGGLSTAEAVLLSDRNRSGDGAFGEGGSWFIILFLIFAIFGWGGNRGFGGFGGGNGGGTSTYEGYTLVSDFSQLSRQLADSTSMTERKLDGVNNGLCSGFYQEAQLINGVNSNIAGSTASIQNTLTQGFSGLNTGMVQQGYETRIGINGIGTQLAQCCCDLRSELAQNKYDNAQNINMLNNSINSGFVAVQQSNCLNTRDIIDNQNANYRALHDEIVANRIEDKNNQIAALQVQLNNAQLKASQEGQTREIINTIRPCPIPAYQSCNPWGCNCNQGCGCNC